MKSIWIGAYKAFATILNNSQYDLILTGHTLSDCAETIILICASGLKVFAL
jgi:tRNA(Ile)-lysidine synthase TilS/MesJ